MTTVSHEKIAEVLEAVAEYVDSIEAEKNSKLASARQDSIAKLASKYEETTGSGLPEAIRNKLASLDVSVIEELSKVAQPKGQPRTLGRASEEVEKTASSNSAEDRFLAWIIKE